MFHCCVYGDSKSGSSILPRVPDSGLLSGRGMAGGGESMLQVGAIVQEGGVNLRVRLLDREERHVQERLVEVDAVATAQDRAGVADEVPGEADARAEVVLVVLDHLARERAADDLERAEGAVLCRVRVVDEAEVHVVANAEVKGEARRDLPVVLRIEGKLLRAFAQVEAGVATREEDGANDTDAGEVGRRAGRPCRRAVGQVIGPGRICVVRKPCGNWPGLLRDLVGVEVRSRTPAPS